MTAASPRHAFASSTLSQTIFQRRAWYVAQNAHSAADRADARILMRMIELVDQGDYTALDQLAQALQVEYRELLGEIPESSMQDPPGAS